MNSMDAPPEKYPVSFIRTPGSTTANNLIRMLDTDQYTSSEQAETLAVSCWLKTYYHLMQ